jgi:hypothetical protein
MAALGFELLWRLAWGWSMSLLLVDRRQSSERFLKVTYGIGGGLALSAAWLAVKASEQVPGKIAALGLLLIGSALYSFLPARATRILGFLALALAPLPALWGHKGADVFNFFSGAAVLGTIFMGQNLGHWYLNVPGMDIRELRRVVHFAIAALSVKILEATYTLFMVVGLSPRVWDVDEMGRPMGTDISGAGLSTLSAGELFGVVGEGAFGLGFYGLLILASRVLWGLLAPALLIYMVKKTVDIRSTQSATGILYALCVMILIGEGAAIYFWRTLGWHL